MATTPPAIKFGLYLQDQLEPVVTVTDMRDAMTRAKALAREKGVKVYVYRHVIETRHFVTMHPDGGHEQ